MAWTSIAAVVVVVAAGFALGAAMALGSSTTGARDVRPASSLPSVGPSPTAGSPDTPPGSPAPPPLAVDGSAWPRHGSLAFRLRGAARGPLRREPDQRHRRPVGRVERDQRPMGAGASG